MSLRNELIQVAAVCVAIVEDLDWGQANVGINLAAPDIPIFEDIHAEREAQDLKWGPQSHTVVEWIAILGEEFGEAAQAANNEYWGTT
jgi:hypothetical protein